MALNFPDNPASGDTFISGNKTWQYNGNRWVLIAAGATVTVTDGAIVAAKIASNAVTSSKILDGTILTADIANDAITTAKILDGAITAAKIADGTIVATEIANDAITTAKILDSNVTTAKIADSNVTTAKIADDAVTQAKLADRVVGSAELDNLTLNAQTGTTYTLVLADAHKLVTQSNASAITTTIPPNSSVVFEVGDQVNLLQLGAGQVTVAAGAGVTIRSEGSKLKLKGQYAAATCIKIGSDEWVLVGNLSAQLCR